LNNRIKVSPVRLIGPDGAQLGIVPVEEALERAESEGLDLVEVSPDSRPTVCRILDYGKFKYEIAKKEKLARKKQHTFQMKEMRYRPKIDGHDFDFKTKHVREFLESGSKVKVFVMFRGREMAYQEFGRRVLDRVREVLADVAVVEVEPKMDGRHMNMMFSPKPEIFKRLKSASASAKSDNEESKEPDEEEVIVESETKE